MTRDDAMASIDLDEVVLVDTATVSSDGRLYLGKEHVGKSVKIVVVEEGE